MKRAYVIEDCHHNVFRLSATGSFDVALDIKNSTNNSFESPLIVNDQAVGWPKISRNSKCPCGSGRKFKRCHGEFRMGTGIKVEGDNNEFSNAAVFTKGDGIVVKGSGNKFPNAKVFIGDAKIAEVIALLGLPRDTPPEMLREVIDAFGESREVRATDDFRLRAWFMERQGDVVAWTQLLVDLGRMLAS